MILIWEEKHLHSLFVLTWSWQFCRTHKEYCKNLVNGRTIVCFWQHLTVCCSSIHYHIQQNLTASLILLLHNVVSVSSTKPHENEWHVAWYNLEHANLINKECKVILNFYCSVTPSWKSCTNYREKECRPEYHLFHWRQCKNTYVQMTASRNEAIRPLEELSSISHRSHYPDPSSRDSTGCRCHKRNSTEDKQYYAVAANPSSSVDNYTCAQVSDSWVCNGSGITRTR